MQERIDLQKFKSLILNFLSQERLDKLRSFFMGKWYPVWIAVSVILGRMLGMELYFALIDFILVSVSLVLCDSIRPVIPNLVSFLYRISLEHSPGVPYYSTYFTGVKMIFFVIFSAMFFAALAYFFISRRKRIFSGFSLRRIPLVLPLCLLSMAFLLGGAFSGKHTVSDFEFAFLQIFVFFVVFLILYFGLRTEKVEELCDYFVYVCAILAVVLSWQVIEALLTVEGIIINGVINKNMVCFGWGISNTCGSAISVLIPICFLGAIKSEKYWIAYFSIATLSIITTSLTLSRSALLVGAIMYIACLIICCFVGDNKRKLRVATVITVIGFIILFMVLGEELERLFGSMINNGLKDNGRYYLWELAFENFKSAPIFGIGFFSFDGMTPLSEFTPAMAHNTVLQLLSSMGMFGLLAYSYYRVCTALVILKHPNKEKMLLMISGMMLIGESLLDNFIFWFNPIFVYNIIIIIAIMYNEKRASEATPLTDGVISQDLPE